MVTEKIRGDFTNQQLQNNNDFQNCYNTPKSSSFAGFGGSLVLSPSLVVVGEYFETRRGLATGIATAGSGVGAFLGPLLMIILVRTLRLFRHALDRRRGHV